MRLIFLLVGTLYLLFSQNARLAAIAQLPLVLLARMTTSFGQRITGLFWAVDQMLREFATATLSISLYSMGFEET